MKKVKLLTSLLGLSLLVIVSGCQNDDSNSASQLKQPAPAVMVTPVIQEKVAKIHELVGRTAALRTVNLVARVQGFLERRNFIEGDSVKEGDILYVIEQAPYQIEVKAAQAKVAEAKATLQNAKSYLQRLKTVRQGGVSQMDLDKASSDFLSAQALLTSAQAMLDRAKLNLSYTEIRSPINGRIGRNSISTGNLVSPNSGILATIVLIDPLYVLFTVSEVDFLTELQNQLEKGESTIFVPKIQLANGTIYPFEGKSDFISPIVDEKTGTITIRAIFPNPDTKELLGQTNTPQSRRLLMPGQFVKVLVRRDDVEEEHVIPQSAMQEDQSGKYVLVVDADNRVQKRSVTVGDKIGVNWIIKRGLQVGELVISEGAQKVRPGITVQTTIAVPSQPIEK
ncbi:MULTISPECIES: efflux RND transporter periplasmic adaptor subunit [Nitrosomonas]|uniref:Membrane fusion protein (Multidrug efflux system) n=2 Tax=Nitrosomonas eutropha TaxID=916 RepID=A0ABX5M4C3_9PROT|nr:MULTISPECIES: efflux RND transporter periplasmic adaptor subunit [Nitrosomonas]MXS79389.1 efflux RND transporter periplasmic adaptor subunit [Nitrosomonas sp. GH22]PXV77014.1 membrane fusion protein (multidrug efflux system) [Nitrosomonas eutropha]SDW82051.1 membrane fusion protein, multidrug efflux system [Nitrosomonas eutropha]SEI98882.1 membrane fusion protein, multidrug efflux system [Nitrosomonas eutropha]